MSRALSLTAAKRDPQAFLDRLREALPAPLLVAGYPDPSPDGKRPKERRHVAAEDIDAVDSLGGDQLRLRLRDGTSLLIEGTTLATLLRRLRRAGYRFLKPHKHHAIRVERAGGIGIDRDPIPDMPRPSRTRKLAEARSLRPDLSRLEAEVVRDEDGSRVVRLLDRAGGLEDLPLQSFLLGGGERRFHLQLRSSEATCPIGPGRTEARVVEALAPFTCPPVTRLDRPEPDSRYALRARREGLITVGGPEFWRLAMKKEKTQEERDAWISQHQISGLSVEDAIRLFRYKGQPQGATEPKHWIERSTAMKNIIWQVHQWMQWGIIDAIKRVEDEQGDGGGGSGGDDGDWWDLPGDDDDAAEKKANIRTLWYRYGKDAFTGWDIHRDNKDSFDFLAFVSHLARSQELVLYREFDFKDRLRRRRSIGTSRPHLLVVTEKDGMEGLTLLFAKRIGGGHLLLSGEPPKITMEYLTRDLVHELEKQGDLEEQEVHVFGLVDFNAAGSNILESVRSDIEHYVERLTGRSLRAVHSHNLVDPTDMTDELVLTERKLQVQYEERWVYVGGRRVKAKDFSDGAGNVSRLTVVRDWYDELVQDERFHEVEKIERGLVRETYYGLEIDDHPPSRLKQRFRDIVTRLGLIG